MKRPGAVRRQLAGGAVTAWVLLIMRLGFHSFPDAAPTYVFVIVALFVTGLLFLYPRMRDAAPDLAIRSTIAMRVGIGIFIVGAALGLGCYVMSFKGAPLPRRVILLGLLVLAVIIFMQWLTDRSQF